MADCSDGKRLDCNDDGTGPDGDDEDGATGDVMMNHISSENEMVYTKTPYTAAMSESI